MASTQGASVIEPQHRPRVTEAQRSPDVPSLLATVARVGAIASQHASASEEARTLAPEAVQALRDSGLLALALPRALGGMECDPLTQATVFEAMARADTSAGWCFMISALIAALAGAYLPDEGARAVFPTPSTYLAGLRLPMGTAQRTDGGYRVQGRWAFGSGARHADWIFTVALLPSERDDAPPSLLDVALPVTDVHIEDTWHVAGLRGSGSDHYRIDDAFVPEAFTCPAPAAPPLRGGPLYRLPMLALIAPGHAAFVLGAAQRALDEITAVAPHRIKAWPQTPLGQHPAFQMDLGRATVKLRAARAYTADVLGSTWDRVRAGDDLTPADWVSLRALTTYTADVAAEVSSFAYRAGGGSALYATSPLQRCFRDLHAATQHIAATDDAYEFAGRHLLGIPEAVQPMTMPRLRA
ncbi:acyl-CoA dehydrogenase family protein [Chondromyces crocatus]|uniref:Acyl-CoA dehydrogenase n=1 Tax=Chondromyces crocatus TaxID=52 RepID=A0A0K1EKA1_CHOCO|nr:acyl-CoA dehydrogenase family protein [Chondromyces crocatus]AKT41291.1 uncharacterized protein CMC5_054580 [Chondromyces crocatus]